MIQPGRKYEAESGYRYGFNGKENDNEVKGEGNQQDYGMRIYDPRLGRFLSEDPITKDYPELTPYQFASNTPIMAIDLDGLESVAVTNKASEYIGTIYEWGGKAPAENWKGVYPKMKARYPELRTATYDKILMFILVNLSKRFMGVNTESVKKGIYAEMNEVNDKEYSVTYGKSSFGIDCSGLARLAFNADKEKIMPDLSIMTAQKMHDKFSGQISEGNGLLHKEFNFIGEGDLVFAAGKKGNVHHVMVATGNVRLDKNNNVSEFEVIHAPESGKLVTREWKKVDKGLTIGHTYRKDDTLTPFKQGVSVDNALENLIKVAENLAKFKASHQYVKKN
jgi:RHS repeat-associated protein